MKKRSNSNYKGILWTVFAAALIVLLAGFYIFFMQADSGRDTGQVEIKTDWPSFMAQHDLIWEDLPLQWNEGAFVGNGQVGMMIYATMKDNRIDFHIGRQDVTDHRKAPDKKTSLSVQGAEIREDFPRLSIGRIVLRPSGKILSGTMRQDLWNAEIRGTIVTDLGEITFRAFTPYDRMLNVVEVTSTEKKSGVHVPYRWEFLRGNANAPRTQTHPHEHDNWSHYIPNPPAEFYEMNGISICVQPLLAGGDFASAWVEKPGSTEGQSVMLLSTANEVPLTGKSAEVAAKTVKEAGLLDTDKLLKTHRDWWHSFFQKSFCQSLTDAWNLFTGYSFIRWQPVPALMHRRWICSAPTFVSASGADTGGI
jgi:alpha-L-fucosidase 2